MDEFIKLLDENLQYASYEIIENVCYITVTSARKEVKCPFCGQMSEKVHSTYERTFKICL